MQHFVPRSSVTVSFYSLGLGSIFGFVVELVVCSIIVPSRTGILLPCCFVVLEQAISSYNASF